MGSRIKATIKDREDSNLLPQAHRGLQLRLSKASYLIVKTAWKKEAQVRETLIYLHDICHLVRRHLQILDENILSVLALYGPCSIVLLRDNAMALKTKLKALENLASVIKADDANRQTHGLTLQRDFAKFSPMVAMHLQLESDILIPLAYRHLNAKERDGLRRKVMRAFGPIDGPAMLHAALPALYPATRLGLLQDTSGMTECCQVTNILSNSMEPG